jgi:hypothetical protein
METSTVDYSRDRAASLFAELSRAAAFGRSLLINFVLPFPVPASCIFPAASLVEKIISNFAGTPMN